MKITRTALMIVCTICLSSICNAEPLDELIQACQAGDLETATNILTGGVDVNAADQQGHTPLFMAVKNQHRQLAELLIQNGADINALNEPGYTLLHWAAYTGNQPCTELLISLNADVNAPARKNGMTPLFLAVKAGHRKIFALLRANGANVMAKTTLAEDGENDRIGQTMLHKAALEDDGEQARFLIQEGANIEARNIAGETPLFVAAIAGSLETAQVLIDSGAYVNSYNAHGSTPIYAAQNHGYDSIIDLLESNGAFVLLEPEPEKPDWWKEKMTLRDIDDYVANGGNINAPDENGNTILHWMAFPRLETPIRHTSKPTQYVDVRIDGNLLKVMKTLVGHGIDIDAKNTLGQTPLHLAVKQKNVAFVASLLVHGADPKAVDKTGDTPLHNLFRIQRIPSEGLEKQIAVLLYQNGADINAKNVFHQTLLHEIAEGSETEMARLLIKLGADVNIATIDGNTALHKAAHTGTPEMVELILKAGGNLNTRNLEESTPFEIARLAEEFENIKVMARYGLEISISQTAQFGFTDRIETWLNEGNNVNTVDDKGYTLLHWVAWYNQPEVAKLLITHGADVNHPGRGNMTPLHYAVSAQTKEMVHILLDADAVVDTTASDGTSPISIALEKDHYEILQLLRAKAPDAVDRLEKARAAFMETLSEEPPQRVIRQNYGYQDHEWILHAHSLLHESIMRADIKTVTRLLTEGADANGFDDAGHTPLVCAVEFNDQEMISLLLGHDADINRIDGDRGFAPLHYAAESAKVDMVTFLLDKGADIQQKTATGLSPLHWAINFRGTDITRLLLARGADVNAQDDRGWTPLYWAVQWPDRFIHVPYLIDAGADIDKKNNSGWTPLASIFYGDALSKEHLEMIDYLLKHGADIHTKDESGDTLLHMAARSKSIPLIDLLLQNRLDINTKNKDGDTPLCCLVNPYNQLSDIDETVKHLFAHGADVNIPSGMGWTPLQAIIENECPQLVPLFLQYNADVHACDKEGKTALHYAATKKNVETVKQLLDAGADPTVENKQGFTPLKIAQINKNEAVVNLLTTN